MRSLLSTISYKLKVPLIHCDMFPFKHEYIIDVGLGESNVINVAFGMSNFTPVFLYGTCGFLLHRFEQLKLNLRYAEAPVILFNAGGSNHPCYKEFGEGHTCEEDIEIAKILKIPVYTPNKQEFEETVSTLLCLGGLKLVRLT